MKVILLGLLFTVTLIMGVNAGYHTDIGIPLATRIKEAEDKLLARTNEKSARIVGGEVVSHNEHPYLAGLLISFFKQSVCGSSLVSENRLVTAAHCAFDDNGVPAFQVEVVLGSQYLYHGGHRIIASSVNVHPGYEPRFSNLNNDIAVIYLSQAVQFSENIRPISLAAPSLVPDQFIWEEAVAAGYGRTSDGREEVLYDVQVSQVRLQVIPEDTCHSFYPGATRPGALICTSGAHGKCTCNGDSGGPLVVTKNGWKILIGITSYGSTLGCQLGYPDSFTPVSSFIDFIEYNLQ